MNSAKAIAEKIIKKGDNTTFEDWEIFCVNNAVELASAYLELEKNLEAVNFQLNEHRQLASYRLHHGIKLESEITKLKKSREVLRKAVEFYSDEQQWNCTPEKLTTYNTIGKDDLGVGDFHLTEDVDDDRVGGIKAREAIKADDEIMKEADK